MSNSTVFNGVFPIGDTEVAALPVKDVASAVGYYTQVLGFSLVERAPGAAVLERDGARIGLAVNGADPDQASCYFAVTGLDALHAELTACLIEPTAIRVDEHDGRRIRVFFAREPYGVCFCFGEPA